MPEADDDLSQQEGGNKKGDNSKGGSKKILFVIIGVLIIAVIGAVIAISMGGSADDESGQQDEESEYDDYDEQDAFEMPAFKQWELDTFVVNLSTGSRYLRTRILLEYDENLVKSLDKSKPQKQEGEHSVVNAADILKNKEPIVKDTIISILSSQKAVEILSLEGKESLKKEIMNKVNYVLGKDNIITNIYFSEFIVQ